MREQKLMQLATVSNGQPWVCSVWYSFDASLNIYFFSAINRRHSVDLETGSQVAGAMTIPHTPQDIPRGLQFEGTATKLTSEADVAHARSVYEGIIFDARTIDKFMADQEHPYVFYKITPTKFVLFDVKNFPDNSRQEFVV